MIAESHPILSCEEARLHEAALFGGDEAKEWAAMCGAGEAVGDAILADYLELGSFPEAARVLVLAGKGHNAGDALIAAQSILSRCDGAHVRVCFVFGERVLRPLARRAWTILVQTYGGRVETLGAEDLGGSYDLCIDGVFGFQFRAPASEAVIATAGKVNGLAIRFRAAVDLPSGGLFRADFTYATGSVKQPALDDGKAGRVRYLDLGFFPDRAEGKQRVLTRKLLDPLRGLRASRTDKRTFGHLFVVAGSRNYPGAALMAVTAALKSGAGLVSAFVPEKLVPAFAAAVPEAIWVGCPETEEGGLALESLHLVRQRMDRASAFAIGSGLGREAETLALVAELVKLAAVPLVLDADALQPSIIAAAKSPLILTPHAGEFERIADGASIADFMKKSPATLVLKGPRTCVASGIEVYHSLFGGPVLARGGSGDLLAGIIGGLLAQTPDEPKLAAARGTVWHGLAADALARDHGQAAVRTTQLLDYLAAALRDRG